MSNLLPDQDLDLSVLYEIADGSSEFIVESIDLFLLHTPETLSVIEAAINDKDWVAAAAGAHKLKANFGFFGMPVSESLVVQIEQTAKAAGQDAALISSKFNELFAIVSTNLVALTQIKQELGG